jgi:hypothetical protein
MTCGMGKGRLIFNYEAPANLHPQKGQVAGDQVAAAGSHLPLEVVANSGNVTDGHQPQEGVVTPVQQQPDTISERARQHLLQHKESQISELRQQLGDRMLAYDAILATRSKELVRKNLMGSKDLVRPDVGNFFTTCDGRLLATKLVASLG